MTMEVGAFLLFYRTIYIVSLGHWLLVKFRDNESENYTFFNLPARYISENYVKINNLIFFFILRIIASKGLMKAFKLFIKPFEPPQRSVKIS